MLLIAAAVSLVLIQLCAAQRCGSHANFALCGNSLCCSQYGWCGNTEEYCGNGCQSGSCKSGSPSSTATTGLASFYTGPFEFPSGCFGYDQNQFPVNQFFSAGGNGGPNIWNGDANCGKWFKIQCTGNGCTSSSTISVRMVDLCPNGCAGGRAFDLSYTALRTIANPDVGVITVQYSGPFNNP